MKRRSRSRITLLQRENQEQLETIKELWSELKLPVDQQIFKPNYKVDAKRLQGLDADKRIKELRDELLKKKKAYAGLEEQITEYIRNAEMYEEQLFKNEEEKAKLLNSFQRVAGTNASELTFDDLESKVEQYHEQFRDLKKEKDAAVKICNRFKARLKHSQGIRNSLISERVRMSIIEDPEDLRQVLMSKQVMVQDLKSRLEDCKKTIRNLTEDNEMLKNALSDDSKL